jgi:hypothetical protein
MKRFVSTCVALLLVVLLLVPMFDAAGQDITLKRIGRSLNSLTAPVRGAVVPPWNYSTGLRAIGKQTRAYFRVDTAGSGQAGSPAWAFVSVPIGSAAAFDSAAGSLINSFWADTTGQYVVSVTVGAQTKYDTVFASTYTGIDWTDGTAGCFCHGFAGGYAIKASWEKTGHAQIFTEAITGQLEVVTETNQGLYAPGCIQCHTTGWQVNSNNGNFGYVAHMVPAPAPNSWDATWTVGLPMTADGRDVMITAGDSTILRALPAQLDPLRTIGCEVCHGPSYDHKASFGDKRKIGKSLDADLCNLCHDGSRRHSIGTYYNLSLHATSPPLEAAAGCQPCHTGAGFLYYMENDQSIAGLSSIWNTAVDGQVPITCQACHDPHGNENPHLLRAVTLKGDSLNNGYVLPAHLRTGVGLLCANCHSARYRVTDRVTTKPPYYGFVDRYGPHHSPQSDMFFGSNGYQYGDETFTGLMTHGGLEDGCATCHMQPRGNRFGGGIVPNHSFSMTDTTFGTGVYKPTDVCGTCHGEIEDFDDIKALYDFDRNGMIEGVQTEVKGLLAALKDQLPHDPTTGEPVSRLRDSLLIKNRPDLVQGLWNYWFVMEDQSFGIHNTKYTVRLLYKSLGWTPLDVEELEGLPKEFALDQNYPNPFNPSTVIRFALPQEEFVRLDVYDITGSLVKTLVDQTLRAGTMEVTWDGSNRTGAKVASGVYLYRLQAGDFTSIKKMVMLK